MKFDCDSSSKNLDFFQFTGIIIYYTQLNISFGNIESNIFDQYLINFNDNSLHISAFKTVLYFTVMVFRRRGGKGKRIWKWYWRGAVPKKQRDPLETSITTFRSTRAVRDEPNPHTYDFFSTDSSSDVDLPHTKHRTLGIFAVLISIKKLIINLNVVLYFDL